MSENDMIENFNVLFENNLECEEAVLFPCEEEIVEKFKRN